MGEEQKMSVGVCVINRNGIALAADSAGTFSPNKMFYNSVNKLFSLSQNNACAAIIYGNLSVYNISVEQIIKEFSIHLDSQQPLKDFYDIVACFKEFLRNKYKYYKFDVSADHYCKQVISAYIDVWGKKIQLVADEDDAKNKIITILKGVNLAVNLSSKISDFDIEKHIIANYEHFFDIEINKAVPDIDAFPNEKKKLWKYICDVFRFEQPLINDSKTGIFFSGYGVNDAYPKFISIDLYKIINGELKYKIKDKCEAINNYAEIKPLAQEDVIYTFCKGISDEYIPAISSEIDSIIKEKIRGLSPSFTEVHKKELLATFANCKKQVNNKISEISRTKHINPIIESVKLISLSEMAFLAENLVNMTSLKRTYCLDGQQQTVGGPTDVAVISKGDGFVWVKNKNTLEI